MNDMRKLINLMEGVVAIPGLADKIAEEDESDMQTQGTIGRDQDDAEFDMAQGMATESVPAVASCQQTNPATADVACAMEEGPDMYYDYDFIASAVRQHYPMATSEEELRKMVAGETGYGNNPNFDKMFAAALGNILNGNSGSSNSGPSDSQVMGMADMHDSDQEDMPFEESLQNGYDDRHHATGSDYFPSGADSPVVAATGPSGARHGDNPEQKKMQVAETHKELVYAYRNYLNESAKPIQKKKLTENAGISDLSIENYESDFEDNGDSITYDGILSMSGDAVDRQGNKIGVGFDVYVVASSGYEEVDDSEPNGWNYRTDQPTYSSASRLELDPPVVKKIQFVPDSEVYITGIDGGNDAEVSLKDAQKYIDPSVLNQLLDPRYYTKALNYYFDRKSESVKSRRGNDDDRDPPERDYHDRY
jgi:hypothetical protein